MNRTINHRPGRPQRPFQKGELLLIARREFARLGYNATSLDAVARAAGLRKASLLHHFPSKENLYLEVLSTLVGEMLHLVEKARLGEGDHVDRLERLGERVTEYLAHNRDAARLMLMELTGQGPYLKSVGRTHVQLALQSIERFLVSGMQAGVFRPQDPFQLALSIVGLHFFYFAGADIFAFVSQKDLFSPEQVMQRRRAVSEQVRALCCGGVERDQTSGR
jgi:TetR/AcrR family transcriptional regulator